MINAAITKRIFDYLGVPNPEYGFSIIQPKFCLEKTLAVELEDKEIVQCKLYGSEGKIANSVIRLLVADLSFEGEYIAVLQMDNLSVYGLKLILDEDSEHRSFVLFEENWVELSRLLVAKFLVGIESLAESLIDYQALNEYTVLYKCLVSFINFSEMHSDIGSNNEKTDQHNQSS